MPAHVIAHSTNSELHQSHCIQSQSFWGNFMNKRLWCFFERLSSVILDLNINHKLCSPSNAHRDWLCLTQSHRNFWPEPVLASYWSETEAGLALTSLCVEDFELTNAQPNLFKDIVVATIDSLARVLLNSKKNLVCPSIFLCVFVFFFVPFLCSNSRNTWLNAVRTLPWKDCSVIAFLHLQAFLNAI